MANAIQTAGLSASQISLIRQTVAKDCNDQEFNLFFEAAKAYGLDPFRKQISALVFNKDKPEKRQMAIIVSRDGYRVIAQRCKNYRPASDPAQIEYDESLKGPANPKGIVKATVRLWQQDNRGEWFPVVGEAYWDEFAAVKDEWAFDEVARKRQPTGQKTLDGNWGRMPIVMITKCAEAQALRAGWPDQFGGIYAEEELHKAETDLTAAEIFQHEAERARMEKIGGKDAVMLSMDGTGRLERIPMGQVADRCMDFLRGATDEEVYLWHENNREPLREFWAKAPSDALAVKQAVEPRIASFHRSMETTA